MSISFSTIHYGDFVCNSSEVYTVIAVIDTHDPQIQNPKLGIKVAGGNVIWMNILEEDFDKWHRVDSVCDCLICDNPTDYCEYLVNTCKVCGTRLQGETI